MYQQQLWSHIARLERVIWQLIEMKMQCFDLISNADAYLLNSNCRLILFVDRWHFGCVTFYDSYIFVHAILMAVVLKTDQFVSLSLFTIWHSCNIFQVAMVVITIVSDLCFLLIHKTYQMTKCVVLNKCWEKAHKIFKCHFPSLSHLNPNSKMHIYLIHSIHITVL